MVGGLNAAGLRPPAVRVLLPPPVGGRQQPQHERRLLGGHDSNELWSRVPSPRAMSATRRSFRPTEGRRALYRGAAVIEEGRALGESSGQSTKRSGSRANSPAQPSVQKK